MSMTIVDSRAAIVEGQSMYEEWRGGFLAQWLAPMLQAAGKRVMSGIDPATLHQLRKMTPNMDAGLKDEINYG